MTSADIRKKFLDFFQSKGHVIVPSAPIVIKNDPTLMFTNAGMNQFKDYFLGNKEAPYKRVTDTQKCLRVSGKHNDLEEVGVDTYHHTMFEMLGNWSFGDYFKKEAIEWSWELLTGVYKISKDRLYVTVFEGDEKENLPRDNEAFEEWKKWIAEDRILLGSKKDNFWEMGDTGPCGPCTEIHVDCRPDDERKKTDGASLVNAGDPRVMEIWNNVFIQFNRLKDGSLEPLPQKHVDTGMGLERLVRVLQKKDSNYDTDLFSGAIAAIGEIANKKYKNGDDKESVAFRVIADHIRAIAFTIADGQLPSNTGAGYVIRRILRRAVRYYYSYLDYKQPLLHQLVPVIAKQFENVFPELFKQQDFVAKVVKEEEEAFLRTLEKGISRFEYYILSSAENPDAEKIIVTESGIPGLMDKHGKMKFDSEHAYKGVKDKVISGEFAFELYDTYGFPLDLTQLLANEKGLKVNVEEFNLAMQTQKSRSRAAAAIDSEDWIVLDEFARNEFVGYDSLEAKTKVVKYRKVKTKGKEMYQLVLEVTPFYAESGGQVGDKGQLIIGNSKIDISDTKKENDLIIHYAHSLPENLNGEVLARVNPAMRINTTLHHTATHLVHAALRKVLGTHVAQKGSLVNDEHLRFDFSHFTKLTDDDISAVEKIVNQKIRENIPVVIQEMPKEVALAMGAMALFGEKYGDKVRVVIIDLAYSVELCGGTHVTSTGELGFFKITHETAVAAGVRRIEAVCGEAAENYISARLQQLEEIKQQLKNPKDILKAVNNMMEENTVLKKQLEHAESRMLVGIRNELLQKDEIINGISFIGDIVEVNNPDALKKICYDLKNNLNNYVVALCANIGGKPYVAVGIDDKTAVAKNLDAGKIIKEHVAPLIKGGGGGQKNLATAGGQDASNLKKVIEKVKELMR